MAAPRRPGFAVRVAMRPCCWWSTLITTRSISACPPFRKANSGPACWTPMTRRYAVRSALISTMNTPSPGARCCCLNCSTKTRCDMGLHGFLQGYRGYADTQALGAALKALRAEGLDQLPQPGSGQTLERFSRLAQVAGHDLRLCKLFEGHTDALAVIAELRSPLPPEGSIWGMWAAEPPTARVRARRNGQRLVLGGRKAWCSGAAVVSHGLLTAWDEEDRQQLVAVDMDQPGITVTDEGWHAVGMAARNAWLKCCASSATGVPNRMPWRTSARSTAP